MRRIRLLYCLMVVWVAGTCIRGDKPLSEQCSQKLPEVMTCVAFASGKETKPQQKCCDSVKEMKESNPACLCFLIQQIHNGSNPALQKMNIQESRLLQLPSACNIANATTADCPKVLKLPPNSPDAAIFNNATNTIGAPATGGATSSTSTTPSHASFKHQPTTLLSLLFFLLFFITPFAV